MPVPPCGAVCLAKQVGRAVLVTPQGMTGEPHTGTARPRLHLNHLPPCLHEAPEKCNAGGVGTEDARAHREA